MFDKLIQHNDDLKLLVEKGYALGFDSNCIVIRDIPYLGAQGQLHTGSIIAKLEFINEVKVKQVDHQIFFAGSVPHDINGVCIPNLGGGAHHFPLSEDYADVVIERSFSNKPKAAGAYDDFFHKIETYVAIISGPAMTKHNIDPYTYRVNKNVASDSIFKLHDTLTSRAEIGDLNDKLKQDVVAIIGVGGTGAYVLDFLAKSPVREIRLFDADRFHIHNAYRSPGRVESKEFGETKASVYSSRYENFRHNISGDSTFIDDSSHESLTDVTFAFVCVDKGEARSKIFDLLISMKIPFIDVGMGLDRKKGAIDGLVRTTYYSPELANVIREKNLAPLTDTQDDIYRANIQIGELNALNAAMAVIKFKQIRGIYHEVLPVYHFLFELGDLSLAVKNFQDEN